MSFVSHLTKNYTQQATRNALVIFDNQGKWIISLEKNIYSIGRSSRNSIVIKSPLISRYHATLFRMKNRDNNSYSFYIIDGDVRGNPSSNGLSVNGNKCSEHSLQHNDIIVFGGEAKAVYIVTKCYLSYTNFFSFYKHGDLPYGSDVVIR